MKKMFAIFILALITIVSVSAQTMNWEFGYSTITYTKTMYDLDFNSEKVSIDEKLPYMTLDFNFPIIYNRVNLFGGMTQFFNPFSFQQSIDMSFTPIVNILNIGMEVIAFSTKNINAVIGFDKQFIYTTWYSNDYILTNSLRDISNYSPFDKVFFKLKFF